jgi:hypothetical protein
MTVRELREWLVDKPDDWIVGHNDILYHEVQLDPRWPLVVKAPGEPWPDL